MNETQPLPNNVFLENSEVVAETLQMLNRVTNEQERAIAALAVELARQTINLALLAHSATDEDKKSLEESVKNLSQKVADFTDAPASDVDFSQTAEEEKGASVPNPAGQLAELLNIAYSNAINTQNQLNIIGQATLTQGVALLYSTVGAALESNDKAKK